MTLNKTSNGYQEITCRLGPAERAAGAEAVQRLQWLLAKHRLRLVHRRQLRGRRLKGGNHLHCRYCQWQRFCSTHCTILILHHHASGQLPARREATAGLPIDTHTAKHA